LSEVEASVTRHETASGNLLLDHLLGAEVIWSSRAERDTALQATFQAAWEAGRRPYMIPYGGSSALGAAAYTYAFFEMLEQGARPDWIIFPSSSGGTHAGLALGARLAGFTGKVLGISVDEQQAVLQQRVAALATATADLLGEVQRFTPQDILVNADYLGGGYGVMGALEHAAVALFARQEGVLLDPVYTGRAAGGMFDLARRGFFPAGASVLFWHTGGAPALFAQRYASLGQLP
jgi:1-aminocyclopropane-1-carboxylate deaminase/D-cysteine desulfhydrase-like pyridoxal-dependent ACC family enzyme